MGIYTSTDLKPSHIKRRPFRPDIKFLFPRYFRINIIYYLNILFSQDQRSSFYRLVRNKQAPRPYTYCVQIYHILKFI